jgi:hypothetical protein
MKDEVINRILTRNTNQPNAVIAKVAEANWDLWMAQKNIGEPLVVVELCKGNYLTQYVKERTVNGERCIFISTNPAV